MNYYLLLVLALAIKDEWMLKLFHRGSHPTEQTAGM
jgi:hypothetical protein